MRLRTAWVFDLAADLYAWFTANPSWRASCQALATHLPPAPGIRVVDLGCGPGFSTIEVARLRPDARLLGLDVAPRMLVLAQRRLAAARLPRANVSWVRGDVAGLPFASASIDALSGHSFLYLLPDREAALAEMGRVLRPGGRVVLMEPNARPATAPRVLRVSRDVRHLVSISLWRPYSRLHGRFTPETLCRTLQSAGFVRCQAEEVLGGLGVLARAEKPERL